MIWLVKTISATLKSTNFLYQSFMKYLLFIIAILGISVSIKAQQVVSVAGQSTIIGGYTVDWTIGEPVTKTISSQNNVLTQGFHQTLLVITSSTQPIFSDNGFTIFPNPVNTKLNIHVSGEIAETLSYRIYGINGRLVGEGFIVGNKQEIDFQHYNSGNYVLQISKKDGEIAQSVKIVKLQN